jgi:hypothetical protein
MNELIKSMDNLPKLVKIILALPFLDIVWAVYRLCKSISKNNAVGIILAVVMLILCPAILWVVDLITIIVMDKVLWID